MDHLTHDEFFIKLAELFSSRKNKDHGKICLTQKRFSYGQDIPEPSAADHFPDLNVDGPLPVLVRASNGKSKPRRADKVKLSTVVEPSDLDAFYGRYAEVCKSGMLALKPRDRTKRKAKAKKKKGGAQQAAVAS
ncbi:signal recognition particle, SRP9/SRP14 subunit [Lasiosphaeria miniovina]|uniref:Signal recognition particle subunit SRP14 n=1 Tax=Lasiosphaeria miniovina TaxID=1954250 RepID=A0AA40DRT8_9PEZI|nr:signal recognition particle, SRP9/SRP14 subunit [Lasiosphaeria miniovina]KAK0713824.1 signal recognition particle, SRP9/SRP14 subunit [Lasiosphaeria miniovina]